MFHLVLTTELNAVSHSMGSISYHNAIGKWLIFVVQSNFKPPIISASFSQFMHTELSAILCLPNLFQVILKHITIQKQSLVRRLASNYSFNFSVSINLLHEPLYLQVSPLQHEISGINVQLYVHQSILGVVNLSALSADFI